MTRRMMRYVIPAGENEITINVMGGMNPVLSGDPDGPIYLFLEENDELEAEPLTFKLFETGEAVVGAYMGTVNDGKSAKHLYWTNYLEERFDGSDNVRRADDVPEMQDSGGSDTGNGASGPGQDVQREMHE